VSHHLYWIVAALAIAATILVSGLTSLVFQALSNLTIVTTAMVGESLILAIITCLAAIIPIVFSVSMLVIQHAAGNYTASVLEQYKKDPKTWFFYSFVAFGVLFASLMLITGSSVLIFSTQTTISLLSAGFSILAFSLVLLPFQLAHVTDLINPKFMIKRAKEDCLREILCAPAKVSSIVKKTKPRNGLERRITQMPLYTEFVFHEKHDTLFMVARQKLLQIMDIVFKCVVKREAETYNDGFRAISEISRAYVSIRKEDSTSDDEFLQDIYSKLLSIPKMALDTEDSALLHAVIDALQNVGCATAEIKPASRWGPNLNASLAMGYVRDIGAKAIERGLWDSAAQAVRSIKNIGVSAIQRARHDGLASKKILDLGREAIGRREWFVVNVASGALNELLESSVKARTDVDLVPVRILEDIEQLSTSAIDNNLEWYALTGLFAIMPEYSIERVAWAALEFKNESHPDIETAHREGYAQNTISSLLDVLARIGTKAAQKKSSMTLTYVVQPMHRIALTLLNEKSISLKDGFDQQVRNVVNALATMYMQAENCPLAWHITDALTDIALHSLDARKGQIASHVVETISKTSQSMMTWDQYGYDSQRLAGRLGVVGSYAINSSDTGIATECANKLMQFDAVYRQTYRGSKDMRHFQVMQELHDQGGISVEEWTGSYKSIPQSVLDQFKVLYENLRTKQLTSPVRASKKRKRRRSQP
jgi:hypothetical protein